VVTAFLRESIRAVTCGSLQTFAELEGVDPGRVAIGVIAFEVGNGIMAVDVTAGKKVEFGRPSGVGVGAVSEGEEQAASRTIPDRNMETIFMFIVLSFIPIIDVK
jgi:hypothetical protein